MTQRGWIDSTALRIIPLLLLAPISRGVLPASAMEGSSGRGGGLVIVCGQSRKTVELLDYYEARTTTDLKIDLGPDTGNYMDQVGYVLNRLSKIDPLLAKRYQARTQAFLAEAKFLPADRLIPTEDDNDAAYPPPGCDKEQLVEQNFDPKPDEPRYEINEDLWKIASDETKAGVVLHEAIYRDANGLFDQLSSDNVRYFNAEIASDSMNRITLTGFSHLLSAARLEYPMSVPSFAGTVFSKAIVLPNRVQLTQVWDGSPEGKQQLSFSTYRNDRYYPEYGINLANGQSVQTADTVCELTNDMELRDCQTDSEIAGTTSIAGVEVAQIGDPRLPQVSLLIAPSGELLNGILVRKTKFRILGQQATLKKDGLVWFYPSGKLRAIDGSLLGHFSVSLKGKRLDITRSLNADFYEDGSLRQIELPSSTVFQVQGRSIAIEGTASVWDNGAFAHIVPSEDTTLLDSKGVPVSVKQGTGVDLDRNERVTQSDTPQLDDLSTAANPMY